jgi:hypothetical protein
MGRVVTHGVAIALAGAVTWFTARSSMRPEAETPGAHDVGREAPAAATETMDASACACPDVASARSNAAEKRPPPAPRPKGRAAEIDEVLDSRK